MATKNLSSAPQAPAASRPGPHPLIKPGYGKRSMPGQLPPQADDFALLPERERSIAGYIDRLPENQAMDIKILAKLLPLYGQQAVGTALRALAVAGYLRRIRCLIGEGGQVRWVYRTFWTRTARDNEWWNAHLTPDGVIVEGTPTTAPVPTMPVTTPQAPEPAPAAAAVPQQRTPAPAPDAAPAPQAAPDGPSPAYLALARLGRTDARLALSAADCEALEARAAEWLARGVTTDYLTQALTAGLPAHVDSPAGFIRRRLTDKIPPALPPTPAPPAPGTPVHRLLVECTECGTPGRPEALPDGLCHPCHRTAHGAPTAPESLTGLPTERDVRAYVSQLRDLLKAP